ncbi:MAG: hypothetical protein M1837_004826 [Sclerophora amabilis]|nr:MAG: hypothetical protein M1837_004826 [Sclerophora amabilis]
MLRKARHLKTTTTKKLQIRGGKLQGTSTDSSQATDKTEIGQIWELLWLCPNISHLIRPLLADFDNDGGHWDYQVAFLLEVVLEVQTIYREYIRAHPGAEKTINAQRILMEISDVMKIIRSFSKCMIKFHTLNFDAAIHREMQFRVLATALNLSQLHGVDRLIQETYQSLRADLTARFNETLNGRAVAKERRNETFGFGDGELFIRYALDSLSQTPGDLDVSVTVVKGIVNVFFAVGLAYNFNYPEAFKCLAVLNTFPDKSNKSHQHFHELYRVTLTLLSLVRYSSNVQERVARHAISQSNETVEGLLERLDKAFRPEFERLKKLGPLQKAAASVMSYPRMLGAEPHADERYAAMGFLFLFTLLSTEFGHLPCFQTVAKLCEDVVIQSAKRDDFKLIRFKAMEVLLSIRQRALKETKLPDRVVEIFSSSNRSLNNPDIAKAMREEAEGSLERFKRKRAFEKESLRSAIEKLQGYRDNLSAEARMYGAFAIQPKPDSGSTEENSNPAPPLKVESAKRVITPSPRALGLGRTASEKSTRSTEAVSHLIRSSPNVGARYSSLEVDPGKKVPSRVLHSITHLSHQGDPMQRVGDTTLPYRPPAVESNRQRRGSTPPLPILDQNFSWERADTEPELVSNAFQQQTPEDLRLSPNSESADHRRASRSTQSSSSLLTDDRRESASTMKIQRVETLKSGTVRFQDKSKRANSVVLSPNCQYVAYVFDREIQVCQTASSSDSITPERLMVLGKEEGSYIAAALSEKHVVAVTAKEVKVCEFNQGQALLAPIRSDPLHANAVPKCIAITCNSDTIAVGLRVGSTSRKREVVHRAVIQLYSYDLTIGRTLECEGATQDGFPTNISFFADGQSILYSDERTYNVWTQRAMEWGKKRLGSVTAKNGGAQGITSITPLYAWSPHPGCSSNNRALMDSSYASRRRYFVLTSILSSIREQNMSFISPLTRDVERRSDSPFIAHFHHSCVSSDGRLLALLEASGKLKLAKLTPGHRGIGLQMVEVPTNIQARIKDESTAKYAGKVGIRGDREGFIVVMVDRHGKIVELRVSATALTFPPTPEEDEEESNTRAELFDPESFVPPREHNRNGALVNRVPSR